MDYGVGKECELVIVVECWDLPVSWLVAVSRSVGN